MRTDVEIRMGERVDDLHRNGYVILQDPKRFCFGIDAVICESEKRRMCLGFGNRYRHYSHFIGR